MARICRSVCFFASIGIVPWLICGCGEAPSTGLSTESSNTGLPTASIGTPEGSVAMASTERKTIQKPLQNANPHKGTPEWTLRKIASLRSKPIAEEGELKKLSADEILKRNIAKNNQIIQLASSVIAITHKNEKQKHLFDAAVHSLMESRLQLALTGNKKEIDAIYEDAQALFKANPKSKSAATGAFSLIRLSETMSKRNPENPAWLDEYVSHTSKFALNFPTEGSRAVVALVSAARYCESQGNLKKAFECYSLITQQFPKSPFTPQADAVLRRLTLTGKILALEGSTIEGAFISMADFKGKVVLVSFWETTSKEFQNDLPTLKAAYEKFHAQGFDILGVSLDKSELAVDQFLEATALPGRQLFNSELSQRGFGNPIVRYYGVSKVPTYWLIDQEGKVASIQIEANQLDGHLQSMLSR